MKAEERIKLAREALVILDRETELKKANDEDIKAEEIRMNDEIQADGDTTEIVGEVRKILSTIDSRLATRKEFNSKIKKIKSAINSIIRGDNDYGDDQMTIDEYLSRQEEPEYSLD